MRIPDNADLFEMHDREMEARARKLPTCDCCGEPIYDKALVLWGKTICENCVDEHMEEFGEDDIY